MADLPASRGARRAPHRVAPAPPSSSAPPARRPRSKPGLPVPASQPSPGVVQVTPENAGQVQAILLQQTRDWLIRNHRLLREIAYYARCAAENRKPTDEEARHAIEAPPERVP